MSTVEDADVLWLVRQNQVNQHLVLVLVLLPRARELVREPVRLVWEQRQRQALLHPHCPPGVVLIAGDVAAEGGGGAGGWVAEIPPNNAAPIFSF